MAPGHVSTALMCPRFMLRQGIRREGILVDQVEIVVVTVCLLLKDNPELKLIRVHSRPQLTQMYTITFPRKIRN